MRGRSTWCPLNVFLLLAVIFSLITSFGPVGSHKPLIRRYFAEANMNDSVDDDDFLAEILAEEARQEEEHAKLEAEAREYEAMRARKSSSTSAGGSMPGGGGKHKMGGNKMGSRGGGASRTMSKGARADLSKLEEELRKKEAESASTKAAQDEEAKKLAEKVRQEREAEFEASLKKMNDEQRKKAHKQKARDARIVQHILKASKAGKHYAVLGIHNLEVQFGPFYIFNFSLGPFVLFRVKSNEIKRVFRNLARIVHPDKNKDGRAEEAFRALETSAAILTDEKKRAEYDKKIISARRRRNKHAVDSIVCAGQKAWSHTISTLRVTKRVLGPFSTPILVMGALIV